MPGSNQSQQNSTTNTNSNTNSNYNLNGASNTTPWAASLPLMQGILSALGTQGQGYNLNSAQNGALNSIEGNANNFNQFNPQITSTIGSLLNGGGATDQAGNVGNNLGQYQSYLTPYANGSMIGNNSALQNQLSTIQNDVSNQINGQFAAAGRDFSPASSQALARGISQGEAPVIANQYNQDVANQLNAAGSLYGAGNTTAGILSGLNQQSLANRQAGIDAIPGALGSQNAGANSILAAEAQKYGIPIGNLGMLAQIGIPIAGLGHSTTTNTMGNSASSTIGNSNTNTTNTPGLLDTIGKIAGIGGTLASSLFGG